MPRKARRRGQDLVNLQTSEPKLDRDLTLREIEPHLEAIFDAMSDGLIVISEVGDIQFFSSGAEKLFGYRREEALQRNVKMLMPSPFREAHDQYLAAYRNTGVKRIIGVGRELRRRREINESCLGWGIHQGCL